MTFARLALFASLFVVGCGDDSNPGVSTCIPGQSAACACADGQTGAQVCQDDGTYGICECTGGLADASVPDAAQPDAAQPDAASVLVPTLFAVTTVQFVTEPDKPLPETTLEIVDLDELALIRNVPLGGRDVQALAVAPDGSVAYVVDRRTGEIAYIDSTTGAEVGSTEIVDPRDVALSADGSSLYVSGAEGVFKVDTQTREVTASLETGADQALGVALSPDQSRLVVAAPGAVYIADADSLMFLHRAAITGSVAGCFVQAVDIRVAGGRAVAWDPNCDALYQVDMASGDQLTDETIELGRDGAVGFAFNARLVYSDSASLAVVLKESDELAAMSPVDGEPSFTGGFSDYPGVLALQRGVEGATDAVHIAVLDRTSDGADTLDTYLPDGSIARGVYTFSDATQLVRDAVVVAVPQ